MIIADTKNEDGLYFALEASVRNKIDTQVILQLMIKHNITTPEEIGVMREYISEQPLYKNMLDGLSKHKNTIDEAKDFENILSKKLNGNNLSHGEVEIALKYLDK